MSRDTATSCWVGWTCVSAHGLAPRRLHQGHSPARREAPQDLHDDGLKSELACPHPRDERGFQPRAAPLIRVEIARRRFARQILHMPKLEHLVREERGLARSSTMTSNAETHRGSPGTPAMGRGAFVCREQRLEQLILHALVGFGEHRCAEARAAWSRSTRRPTSRKCQPLRASSIRRQARERDKR